MIQLQNFSIGHGQRCLLDDVDARFECGHLTALLGRNGTGKSTMLRAIAGLNRRYSGVITLGGDNIATLPAGEMARRLALVTTERIRIAGFSCREVVATGRAPYTNWTGRLSDGDREIVDRAIATVGIESFADRSIGTLSDGEAQRVMIARAIAQATPVIILDEPTSFLDLPTRRELVGLLRTLADEGRCILFSTHELDLALEFSTDIALLTDRRLIVAPTPATIASGILDRIFR